MISVVAKEGAYNVKTIMVDDYPWKDIHSAIFGRQDLDLASTEQFEILENKKVKAFVYKKLAQKSYSSFELKKLLKEYLVSSRLIDAILDECINLGYINDKDWIDSFIRSAKNKKCGPEWILQKLMSKGIDRETAKNALSRNDSAENRIGRIKSLIDSRYKARDLTDYSEKQKIVCSLIRKGFSFEDIKSAFGR